MLFEELHDVAVQDMLNDLAAYRCHRHWPVVGGFTLFLHTGQGFPRVFTGAGNVVLSRFTCVSYPPRL